jgi:voltage-gated potassium channel
VDYLLRWFTADYKLPDRKRWQAFLLYPLTPFAIIDLLSILPSFTFFNQVFKLFRVTRLMKILRVFKFLRYSRNMQILLHVLYKERQILFTVFLIALSYIVLTALIMFNLEESQMFEDYFDALYWATTTLTTVGYGDICPTTDIGRIISMFSAIFGVAVIALPSGVITASYLDELRESKRQDKTPKKE